MLPSNFTALVKTFTVKPSSSSKLLQRGWTAFRALESTTRFFVVDASSRIVVIAELTSTRAVTDVVLSLMLLKRCTAAGC